MQYFLVLVLLVFGNAPFSRLQRPQGRWYFVLLRRCLLYLSFPKTNRIAVSLAHFFPCVHIRIVVGTAIYVGHYEEFFGGDANTSTFSLRLCWLLAGDKWHIHAL